MLYTFLSQWSSSELTCSPLLPVVGVMILVVTESWAWSPSLSPGPSPSPTSWTATTLPTLLLFRISTSARHIPICESQGVRNITLPKNNKNCLSCHGSGPSNFCGALCSTVTLQQCFYFPFPSEDILNKWLQTCVSKSTYCRGSNITDQLLCWSSMKFA